MRKTLFATALLALSPLTALAANKGPSYTYVEAGWTQTRVSDDLLDDPKLDGGYIRGSYAIGLQAYVFGAWSTVSKSYRSDGADLKLELNQPELGVGYRLPISDRVDFTADIAWVRQNAEARLKQEGFDTLRQKDHFNAGRATLGVRTAPTSNSELWVKGGYLDGSDMDGTWVGVVGGQFKFTPNWGLVGEVQVVEDITQLSAGVRATF
ncbi:outer membrane beta-barrel protein [Stenotrophomonas sp.]|uniref:outer membrane beta-barrel protein n=1 Tax=Stenotrophomonas sp. TaxID=69392 RepID=UPI002D4B564E|nr:outer membrane beta-barrel protein [Stenotrophomonas sp.]HYQ22392.1 outer membrane beta-barrel protein [Stenotrophomonas sp.]